MSARRRPIMRGGLIMPAAGRTEIAQRRGRSISYTMRWWRCDAPKCEGDSTNARIAPAELFDHSIQDVAQGFLDVGPLERSQGVNPADLIDDLGHDARRSGASFASLDARVCGAGCKSGCESRQLPQQDTGS